MLFRSHRSGLFDRIVVSTDDEEISTIAKIHGAEVPFMRPAELADDHTPTVPVIAHSIEACRRLGWSVSHVCCIYPGVPFIETGDLREALALLENANADYCFPVTEFPSAIQRALRRLPDGRIEPFDRRYELTRTQDLEPAYHDAGQFYWGKTGAWLTKNRIHSSGIGLPIPGWRVVDIDTPADWNRAELIYKAINSPGTQ